MKFNHLFVATLYYKYPKTLPLTAMQSFVVKGTPSKGISLSITSIGIVPLLINSSTFSASFLASSKRLATTQFSIGFISSIRSMNEFITYRLVT